LRNISTTIYLYKKTHNKTGLQYLGKTTQDPFKYKGSGKRWGNHINKHGYDVTTEILKECSTNEEVKEWGIHYSNLWNIVDSREWANLKPEYGDGGGIFGKGNGMYGKTHSDELKASQAVVASTRFKGKSYDELYGTEKATELKKKRSMQLKGKNNAGKNNPRAKRILIVDPLGNEIECYGNLKDTCKELGLSFHLIYGALRSGKVSEHPKINGYSARYLS
jgi:hypothetical protein